MDMTGAEAIVASLERAGVEYVFGLCGHANLSLLDALGESSIEFVPVRNEQNAAHMADAYYRVCHKPAIVLTTIGPGLANAVTGIWEAAMDSSAVIVISGNVPSYMIGRGAFQELAMHNDGDQASVLRPFVKRAWRVESLLSVPFVMQRAFNVALSGNPGPVLVDVPMDYASGVADFSVGDPADHRATGRRVRGDRSEIERAAALLLAADRPLIHVGNGCSLSEASEPLRLLAEHLSIPVTTSAQAQGVFPNTHRLSGGYPGAVGTPEGNALARTADVVLAVGTRFSEIEVSSWDPKYSFGFAADSSLLQVDIDPQEIGRVYPAEVGIVGDAGAVLGELLEIAINATAARHESQVESVQILDDARREGEQDRVERGASDDTPINVQRVLKELGTLMDESTIVLADAGTFRHVVGQYLPFTKPQQWFVPSGLGTMGGAAPAALGAKIARPNDKVVCLIGDGGMSANDHALATAVEWGLGVVYIVLNNFAWDSIRTYQHIHFDGRIMGTELTSRDGSPSRMDFVAVAEAYGMPGELIKEPEDVAPALARALASDGPCLLEIRVAPTRLVASGNWDVGDLLAAEGEHKRSRAHHVPA